MTTLEVGTGGGDYQVAPSASNNSNAAPSPSNNSARSTYGNSSIASTFFVYSGWTLSAPLASMRDEPRLGHGVLGHLTGEALITETLLAGALYSSCRDPLQKFERYEWRHYLYLAGIVFVALGLVVPNHGLLEHYVDEYLFEDVGDWVIGLALALVIWAIALLVHAWAVWRLEINMTAAVEGLNYPLFQLAGYRAHYRVEPTGPCYTLEHRIYVLYDKTRASGTLLELMPDSTRPLFAGGKTVYLHTASNICGNDEDSDKEPTEGIPATEYEREKDKEYLHHHEQPDIMKSIHPFLWGALHQAFWVEEMDQLRRQRRIRTGDALVATLLALLWALPAWGHDQEKAANAQEQEAATKLWLKSWLLAVIIILAIVIFFVVFLKVLINRSAQTVGHVKWERATDTWGPVMGTLGWRLDYVHPNTDEGSTIHPPVYFLRFVPVAETHVPVAKLMNINSS